MKQTPYSDVSHVDGVTGARKRKKKSMDDMRTAAYRKALLDLLFVQATTGQLLGADQMDQGMAPPPMAPPPQMPPMQAPPMQGGMPPPMMGGMGG